jgi:hypothetical protein
MTAVRVPLSDGGWADLRDPAALRVKDRNWILERANIDPNTPAMVAGLGLMRMLLARMVLAWSVPYLEAERPGDVVDGALRPPGECVDLLDDLTLADETAITDAVDAHRQALFPNHGPSPDEASFTQPSAG